MALKNIVVLDDGNTWGIADGAKVVLNVDVWGAESDLSSGRVVSVQELIQVWRQQQEAAG